MSELHILPIEPANLVRSSIFCILRIFYGLYNVLLISMLLYVQDVVLTHGNRQERLTSQIYYVQEVVTHFHSNL